MTHFLIVNLSKEEAAASQVLVFGDQPSRRTDILLSCRLSATQQLGCTLTGTDNTSEPTTVGIAMEAGQSCDFLVSYFPQRYDKGSLKIKRLPCIDTAENLKTSLQSGLVDLDPKWHPIWSCCT